MQDLSRTVEWKKDATDLSQVYNSGMEFAFCTSDYRQQLPWVYCKDFLHDAVFSCLHGTNLNIFGYKYDPGSDPAPNLRRMRLMVTNKSDKALGDKVPNAVDLVNQVELALGVPSATRVFRVPDPPKKYSKCGVFLFSGSRDWLLAAPMISMYTLMVRAGFGHTAGTPFRDTIKGLLDGSIPVYQKSDADQLRIASKGIERLIRAGYRNIFSRDMKSNYPPMVPVITMHNAFGIVGFSAEHNKTLVPSWYKDLQLA